MKSEMYDSRKTNIWNNVPCKKLPIKHKTYVYTVLYNSYSPILTTLRLHGYGIQNNIVIVYF